MTVTNANPSRGMFSSIQAGLVEASADAVVVLPADMPFVQPGTIRGLVEQCLRMSAAVVPAHDGRRGHPLVVPGSLRDGLLAADATASLKDALLSLGAGPREIDVEDAGVLRDVDRREDLDSRRS